MKDHISVCICTYHRNQTLERLLRKLSVQETAGLFAFSAIVVDNDAAGPAEEVVCRLKDELGIVITYAIESERTIPAARNHALRLATGNYIGIIDDDEFPPQNWLVTMYRAIQTFDVDGSLGPVFPYFEQEPPTWLLKGGFCERPVHRTGTHLRWDQTRTGNVLLKKDVFEKHNLSFDLKFQTSGSDRAFFKDAMKAGCRFIAVHEAPVYEVVPPERWQKSYYLKRALVHGYNAYKTRPTISLLNKTIILLRSATALLTYTVIQPICYLIGTHSVMKYAEKSAHHLSQLFAMFGIQLIDKRDF